VHKIIQKDHFAYGLDSSDTHFVEQLSVFLVFFCKFDNGHTLTKRLD